MERIKLEKGMDMILPLDWFANIIAIAIIALVYVTIGFSSSHALAASVVPPGTIDFSYCNSVVAECENEPS